MPNFVYDPPLTPYLDILYYDDDIIVLNKPSGLLTVPGKDIKHRDCLESRVKRVFPLARIIHRLDMATSGIILMAQHKPAQGNIGQQFEKRKTEKSYVARIHGIPTNTSGRVDLPLICDWPNRPKQMVDHERGKSAQTDWTIENSHEDGDKSWSRVLLKPITGRSHQLRVHMLALGHPILGDRLYAKDQALSMASRLQLHAASLSFTHPSTEEWLTFEKPAPF